MLEPTYLNAAVELNQETAEKGQYLYALADTPLGMLVRQTPNLGSTEATSYETLISQLVDMSRTEEHAEIMQRTREMSVESVRQTMNFARNTVNPHIRKVIGEFETIMKGLRVPPPAYTTNRNRVADVYMTSVARNFVERWENGTPATEPADFFFGSYEPQEILDLVLLTDNENFNSLMREYLTANNGAALAEIAKLLRGETRLQHMDPQTSLAVSLVAQAIETPKEGVRSSITAYQLARSALGNVAGRSALRLINRVNDNLQASTLYTLGFNQDPSTINLNDEVYRKFLKEGLEIETLFGNELLGRPYYGSSLLDPEVITKLKKVYADDLARRTEAHSINARVAEREAVMTALKADHARIVAENAFVVEGDNSDKSFRRMRSMVDSVMQGRTLSYEPTTLIAAIICGTWYTHTDAARILDITFDISKRQPELKPDELAMLATLRYIATWVASMIDVGVPAAMPE